MSNHFVSEDVVLHLSFDDANDFLLDHSPNVKNVTQMGVSSGGPAGIYDVSVQNVNGNMRYVFTDRSVGTPVIIPKLELFRGKEYHFVQNHHSNAGHELQLWFPYESAANGSDPFRCVPAPPAGTQCTECLIPQYENECFRWTDGWQFQGNVNAGGGTGIFNVPMTATTTSFAEDGVWYSSSQADIGGTEDEKTDNGNDDLHKGCFVFKDGGSTSSTPSSSPTAQANQFYVTSGHSAQFDGDSGLKVQVANYPAGQDISTFKDFTIQYWFKSKDEHPNYNSNLQCTFDFGFATGIYHSGKTQMITDGEIMSPEISRFEGEPDLHINYGDWNHFCLMRKDDSVVYYINGSGQDVIHNSKDLSHIGDFHSIGCDRSFDNFLHDFQIIVYIWS